MKFFDKIFRKSQKKTLDETPKKTLDKTPERAIENHVSGCYSDVGRRQNQQDSCLVSERFADKQLFLVADGVGGNKFGEFASGQAVEVFKNLFAQNQNFRNPTEFLSQTALIVSTILQKKSQEDPNYNSTSTTLTGFMLINNLYYTINVGDSRVYLFSDNQITQKTKDHSYVQHLMDKGLITAQEAKTHPKRNLITSVISPKITQLKISTDGPFELKKNDILIACSDGLHGALDDEDIKKIISENQNKANLAEILVKKAYDAGSKDNITVCFYKH